MQHIQQVLELFYLEILDYDGGICLEVPVPVRPYVPDTVYYSTKYCNVLV